MEQQLKFIRIIRQYEFQSRTNIVIAKISKWAGKELHGGHYQKGRNEQIEQEKTYN